MPAAKRGPGIKSVHDQTAKTQAADPGGVRAQAQIRPDSRAVWSRSGGIYLSGFCGAEARSTAIALRLPAGHRRNTEIMGRAQGAVDELPGQTTGSANR